MSIDLSELLKMIGQAIALEKKIEESIAAEKDINRREKMMKAWKERDLETIHEILYSVK